LAGGKKPKTTIKKNRRKEETDGRLTLGIYFVVADAVVVGLRRSACWRKSQSAMFRLFYSLDLLHFFIRPGREPQLLNERTKSFTK
jgi:hypothetical protein